MALLDAFPKLSLDYYEDDEYYGKFGVCPTQHIMPKNLYSLWRQYVHTVSKNTNATLLCNIDALTSCWIFSIFPFVFLKIIHCSTCMCQQNIPLHCIACMSSVLNSSVHDCCAIASWGRQLLACYGADVRSHFKPISTTFTDIFSSAIFMGHCFR